MTTTVLLSLLVASIAVSIWFWCVFLRMGFRWVKFDEFTGKRLVSCAVLAFVVTLTANLVIKYAFSQTPPEPDPPEAFFEPEAPRKELLEPFLQLVVGVGLQVWIISAVFHLKWRTSFRAWLPTLIPGLVVMAYSVMIIKPYVFEGYEIPSMSMAPTILGDHWVGTCSKCGGVAYGKSWDEETKKRYLSHQTICENFHLNTGTDFTEKTVAGDRLLVMKFLKPRRWDIVTFQFPEDPSRIFLQRLVGLPGEEVFIDEGAVWIDGQRLDPPPEIAGIVYRFVENGSELVRWGTRERPAILGDKEYFTLGDFTLQSLDSRYWGHPSWSEEFPEQPPYAVPEENLQGVATHRYWPPSRWIVLR